MPRHVLELELDEVAWEAMKRRLAAVKTDDEAVLLQMALSFFDSYLAVLAEYPGWQLALINSEHTEAKLLEVLDVDQLRELAEASQKYAPVISLDERRRNDTDPG